MNEKWELFCREYLKDLNATKAYRRAYPDSGDEAARRSASQLMTNPDIVQRIRELIEERNDRVNIEVDNVLESILTVRDRCMQNEPVLGRDGKPTGEYQFDSRGALKANELLGRHLGAWNDKLKLHANVKTERFEDYLKRVKRERR